MIKQVLSIFIAIAVLMPVSASALTMDELISGQSGFVFGSGQVLGTQNFTAHSVVVLNQVTGETLLSQRPTDSWEPASLTKLLTALTVLDTKPNFNKVCTIDRADQASGARLAAVDGGAYLMKDLFAAMLVGSANNAANALANQCTGLSKQAFLNKMNEKAKSLGATNSHFVDPSGLSESNRSTAADMAVIANAAFSTQAIREVTQMRTVSFSSRNRPIKTHNLTSTSKSMFEDPSFNLVAGKTGLLNNYNYAASTRNSAGQYLITVVLGSPSQKDSFDSTKIAASLGFGKIASKVAAASAKKK